MSGGIGFGNFTYAPEATSAARNADFYVLETAADGVTQIVSANASIAVSPAGGTGVVTLTAAPSVSQIVAGDASITVSPAGGQGVVTLTVPPPIFPAAEFVPGMIMMWNSSTPPDGWLLCNGQPGTPDLTDRFVIGAGGSTPYTGTGGATTATIGLGNLPTLQSPFTVFTGAGTIGSATLGQGGGDAQGSSNFTVTGTGANTALDILPPYIGLFYIIKT